MKQPVDTNPDSSAPALADAGPVMDVARKRDLRLQIARQMSGEGAEAIDDVLQEVELALHRAGDSAPATEFEEAWLRQVATHKVQDYWRRVDRRRKLRARLIELADGTKPPEQSPYEWVVSLEHRRNLRTALEQLPHEDRTLLQDKYLAEQTCQQIAASRKISVKAVEYRLLRARQAIRQLIENLTQ